MPWAQALLTATALTSVVLATLIGVRAITTSRADAALHHVLDPTLKYLDQSPDEPRVDWPLLASEIEELRPPDTRVEIRRRGEGTPMLLLGRGPEFAQWGAGCRDHDLWRLCGALARQFTVVCAKDRSQELAAQTRADVRPGHCVSGGRFRSQRDQSVAYRARASTAVEPRS